MRKEMLIAIFVGLTLGLIITYGFYMAKLSTQKTDVTNRDNLENSSGLTIDEGSENKLNVTQPLEGILVGEAKLPVTGQTLPNAFVVVSLGDQILVTTANDQGAFTQDLTLKSGGNIVIVQTTDENGDVTTVTRTVVFADNALTTASGSATLATPSSSPTPSGAVTKTPTKATAKPTVTPKLSPTPKP